MGSQHTYRWAEKLFIGIVFAALLLPLIGMAWAPTHSTTENRTLAPAPCVTTESGKFNINILNDAGLYFEDHFAYRNALVSTNARIRAALGSSATDQVIVGTQGWLYYAGTLPDYLGQSALSERALRNIAHNLALLQGFAQSRGAQFVFVVAPNKNTLYPEHMPSNYLRSMQKSNWERLVPYLDEYHINYANLFDVLAAQEDVLYYQRDTHWNNAGALIGGNAILDSLDLDPVVINDWTVRKDYTGDIAQMLFPQNPGTEEALYAPGFNDSENQTGTMWRFSRGSNVEEDFVQTNGGAEGTLVMYRDSFANALIPYYATQFKEATFSKLVPYDAATISMQEADYCVVERAERHLDYLAQHAPIMPAPVVKLNAEVPAQDTNNAGNTKVQVSEDGGYTVVSGEIDERLHREHIQVYLVIPQNDGSQRIYEASTISASPGIADGEIAEGEEAAASTITQLESDYGFVAYLPGNPALDQQSARILYIDNDEVIGVTSF